MFIIFIFKGILIKASGHSFKAFSINPDIQIVCFLKVGHICVMEQEKHWGNQPFKDGQGLSAEDFYYFFKQWGHISILQADSVSWA